MTALMLGLGLAVIGSVALNGSYLLQHAGSRAAPTIDLRRPVSTIAGLLRSRWWLVGTAAGLLGSALHVAALAHAPLSLVQAFTAGGLALTVPVAARAFGQRLDVASSSPSACSSPGSQCWALAGARRSPARSRRGPSPSRL